MTFPFYKQNNKEIVVNLILLDSICPMIYCQGLFIPLFLKIVYITVPQVISRPSYIHFRPFSFAPEILYIIDALVSLIFLCDHSRSSLFKNIMLGEFYHLLCHIRISYTAFI